MSNIQDPGFVARMIMSSNEAEQSIAEDIAEKALEDEVEIIDAPTITPPGRKARGVFANKDRLYAALQVVYNDDTLSAPKGESTKKWQSAANLLVSEHEAFDTIKTLSGKNLKDTVVKAIEDYIVRNKAGTVAMRSGTDDEVFSAEDQILNLLSETYVDLQDAAADKDENASKKAKRQKLEGEAVSTFVSARVPTDVVPYKLRTEFCRIRKMFTSSLMLQPVIA